MSVIWAPTWLFGRERARLVMSGRWLVIASEDAGTLASMLDQIDQGVAAATLLLDSLGTATGRWGGPVAVVDLGSDPIALAATAGVHIGTGDPPGTAWETRRAGWAGPLPAVSVVVSLDRDAALGAPGDEGLAVSGVWLSRLGARHEQAPDETEAAERASVQGAPAKAAGDARAPARTPERPGGRVHYPGRLRPPAREPEAPRDPPVVALPEFELIDLHVPTRAQPLDDDRPAESTRPPGHEPVRAPDEVKAPEPDHIVEEARGKRCVVSHLNHPLARYCYRCGRGFDATASVVLVRGPRPPLGVIVDAAGRRYPVDGPLVAGRRPARDPGVVTGSSTPIELNGELVSRIHLEISTRGWDVVVTDRSANGTFLWGPSGWQALPSGTPVTIAPGATIRLGRDMRADSRLRFLSHHLANDAPAPPT